MLIKIPNISHKILTEILHHLYQRRLTNKHEYKVALNVQEFHNYHDIKRISQHNQSPKFQSANNFYKTVIISNQKIKKEKIKNKSKKRHLPIRYNSPTRLSFPCQ